MKLQSILQNVFIEHTLTKEQLDLNIQGIADNSADVRPHFLFIAISGYRADGHRYIDEAVKQGASAVLGEQDISHLPVPYIKVENSRRALGKATANFYQNSSKEKVFIGITGTNGKTTTSYLIRHLLESAGKSCALIGSVQTIINGQSTNSRSTTPSALVLHKLLSSSKDDVVVMEVSSHGLEQYRTEGISFDYCLFTNLSHDHLDYHHTMENYYKAKKKLFDYLHERGKAIINTDTAWGEKLAQELKAEGKTVHSIGMSIACDAQMCDWKHQDSTIMLHCGSETHSIFSPLAGIHNMYNTALAYYTLQQLGLNKSHLRKSLHHFKGVQGRFETLKNTNGATIVIDYAHTTDAIEHCLQTAKQLGAKKITHIFGLRGDRDTDKRKAMLAATCKMSDEYILTFDDLNSVSSTDMIHTLFELQQTYGNEKGKVIPDRTVAIQRAIENSGNDEWIIITGKGHERYEQAFLLQTKSDQDTVLFLNNKRKGRIKES